MRRFFMIFTLAASLLAVAGISNAGFPPDCGANCHVSR